MSDETKLIFAVFLNLIRDSLSVLRILNDRVSHIKTMLHENRNCSKVLRKRGEEIGKIVKTASLREGNLKFDTLAY